MKTILLLTMALSGLTASATEACKDAYSLIKYKSHKREIVQETEVIVSNAKYALSGIIQDAFKEYQAGFEGTLDSEDTVTIQLAIYKDKENSKTIHGYRVRLDSEYHDEDVISYYYSSDKRLLKFFHDSQSPESHWVCDRFPTKKDENEEFIEELANDIGGSLYHVDESEYLYYISADKLPKHITLKGVELTKERAEEIRTYDENSGSAFLDEESQYEIRRYGELIGYVIHIGDVIDHPLWDGSGILYYLNLDGTVITYADWND